jgi:hypothetical protein
MSYVCVTSVSWHTSNLQFSCCHAHSNESCITEAVYYDIISFNRRSDVTFERDKKRKKQIFYKLRSDEREGQEIRLNLPIHLFGNWVLNIR